MMTFIGKSALVTTLFLQIVATIITGDLIIHSPTTTELWLAELALSILIFLTLMFYFRPQTTSPQS